MARDQPKTQDTLMLAAKAAADVSATAGTMLDVLQSRAFSFYAEGLRQYLTIRTGDAEKGLIAFARVRDRAAGLSDEELTQDPGIRARLYRFAREESTAEPKKSKTLAWYRPRNPAPKHQTAVARIRSDAKEKELLELRYARDLNETEIAYVVEMDEAQVHERLEAAYENARSLHGSAGKSLPKALLEAFALEKLNSSFAPAIESDGNAEASRSLTKTSRGALQSADDDEELQYRIKLGTVLGERYQLKKHIGAGGFADVYRAEDVEVPGHVLALKVLKRPSTSEDKRQSALKELRIIAAVYHPSIVQFKDYGWFEGRLWFAMPWYEGEVLESRLEEGAGLKRGEAQAIFVPLTRALATLHAANIRHQDVKPDNIFLATLRGFEGGDHDVLPVLLDLGVAAKDAELVLAGTPTYFAPEVAAQFAYREGDPFPSRPIGPAADVFALALSLRNSLEPETQPDVAAGAVDAFIRERAGTDETLLFTRPDLRFLNKPLARWLAANPEDRPTADQFADELAILSKPEKTRARRVGYLKLFGPIAVAIALLVGFAFNELRQHNMEDRAKAELAQEEADAARRDLEDEETRREELETQVGEAEAEIAEQHLSKTELERELASARGRLRVEQRRLAASRRQTEEKSKAVEAAETLVESTTTRLRAAEARASETQSELQTRELDLANVRRELASARSAQSAAEGNLQSARRDLSAAQESQVAEARRAQTATERAAAAQRDLTQANEQLRQARAQITQLERDLAAARRRNPTPTVPNNPVTPTVMIPTQQPPTTGMRVRRPR